MLPTLDQIAEAEADIASVLNGDAPLDLGMPAPIDLSKLPLLLDIPAAKYHADPCPRPSLSASIAHTLTSKSPLHAWLQHPKLGRTPRTPTDDMDFGSLVHALVLHQEFDLEIVHADNWKRPVNQEKRDRARTEGRICVLAKMHGEAIAAAKEIHVELRKAGIMLTGISEAVILWEEQTTAGPVLCRGMMDHVIPDAGLIIDLKTIRSAHPDQCTRNVMDHGYHVQAAAYTSAIRQLSPEAAGREQFRWVFAEVMPAGSPKRVVVTIAKPSGAMRELGSTLWTRACETWAKCLGADHWPGYVEGEASLEPPAWALRDQYEAAGEPA